MKMLDDYFRLEKEIYAYFGYIEKWTVYPISDSRNCYWRLSENEGSIWYANKVSEFAYYGERLVLRDFRTGKPCVYRGDSYTMVIVDIQADGNIFMEIFANNKERPLRK